MSELSNEQLLVSAAGVTLDADTVRLAAPLEGEAAYSSAEDLASYGLSNGVPLLEAGEGVELSDPELAEYMLIDTLTGESYSTAAGWKVLNYDTYAEHPSADASDPASMRELYAGAADVSAPSNFADLESLPFESVTGAF